MFSSCLDLLWFCGLSIYASFVAAASSKHGLPLPSSHLSLSSFNWTLSNANRSIILSTPFLNQPHLTLINASIIDQPNIGLNEGTVRWVGEEEAWTWETTLQIGAHLHWTGVNRVC
ncbi:hypothetical protein O181_088559 [Austropuccinia psidii MF-1]|uniref:Beta-mannosidase-like galactose-binding domain-containing protein n=1 Tax=Austropuccinia psidii MF-1 TaxID=1389203 RepID=A0A9Q3IRY8_9BASI|nr:hypothetical protein [Austropuccinia psidii MF-1]